MFRVHKGKVMTHVIVSIAIQPGRAGVSSVPQDAAELFPTDSPGDGVPFQKELCTPRHCSKEYLAFRRQHLQGTQP